MSPERPRKKVFVWERSMFTPESLIRPAAESAPPSLRKRRDAPSAPSSFIRPSSETPAWEKSAWSGPRLRLASVCRSNESAGAVPADPATSTAPIVGMRTRAVSPSRAPERGS